MKVNEIIIEKIEFIKMFYIIENGFTKTERVARLFALEDSIVLMYQCKFITKEEKDEFITLIYENEDWYKPAKRSRYGEIKY